jgi:hypothetical protein
MLVAGAAGRPVHGVFAVLLVATGVVWLGAELRQALKRRPEAPRTEWGSEVVTRVAIVAGALGAALAATKVQAADITPQPLAARLGLLLVWCGVALRIWCLHTLGHPGDTGILLVVVGLGLLIGNWLSVVALAAGATFGLAYPEQGRRARAGGGPGRWTPRLRRHPQTADPLHLVSARYKRPAGHGPNADAVPSVGEGHPCDDTRGGWRPRSRPPV